LTVAVVPGNIHTHSKREHWTFLGEGGANHQDFLQESMKVNRNFQRAREVQTKDTQVFSGTTHSQHARNHCHHKETKTSTKISNFTDVYPRLRAVSLSAQG